LKNKTLIFCMTFILSSSTALQAGGNPDDILFFFVEKVNHYDQSATGELTLKDYGFATAIFGTGKGKIESATVVAPENKGTFLPEDHGRMYVFVKDYDSIAAVNEDFPDGEYQVSIKSEHNNIIDQKLVLAGKGEASDYPPAPKVELAQDGVKVDLNKIDPNKDLTLSWTPFSTGKADPRKILDDIIIILTDDCKGEVAGSSGLPFTDRYLTYKDDSYTIKAGSLNPGVPYSFRVEHIRNTDTARNDNVPGLAVYVVITTVYINTSGEAVDTHCTG
jgi:hypothetical protein